MSSVAYCYIWAQDAAEVFLPFAERWAQGYLAHPAGCEHQLYVVVCGPEKKMPPCLSQLKPKVIHYNPCPGWDLGGSQFAASHVTEDFMVCGTSRHFAWKPGYLAKMRDAFDRYGDNLYADGVSLEACPLGGPTTEFPNAHTRGAFYGLTPKRFRQYPFLINTREKGFLAECGERSLARWFWHIGLRVIQVTWDGCYEKQSWPNVPNTFRRGDQSALLVKDKHSELFLRQTPAIKAEWARRAWG